MVISAVWLLQLKQHKVEEFRELCWGYEATRASVAYSYTTWRPC